MHSNLLSGQPENGARHGSLLLPRMPLSPLSRAGEQLGKTLSCKNAKCSLLPPSLRCVGAAFLKRQEVNDETLPPEDMLINVGGGEGRERGRGKEGGREREKETLIHGLPLKSAELRTNLQPRHAP